MSAYNNPPVEPLLRGLKLHWDSMGCGTVEWRDGTQGTMQVSTPEYYYNRAPQRQGRPYCVATNIRTVREEATHQNCFTSRVQFALHSAEDTTDELLAIERKVWSAFHHQHVSMAGWQTYDVVKIQETDGPFREPQDDGWRMVLVLQIRIQERT